MSRFLIITGLCVLLSGVNALGQKKKEKSEVSDKNFVSFGIEGGPIIPTTLFNRSNTRIENLTENIKFTLDPLVSYRFGGALRFDIYNFKKMQLGNMFTLNTGIYYTQRAFRVKVDDISDPVQDVNLVSDRFRFTSYEIPLMLQLHLQASERIWVNFAVGSGVEFFPSQVYTTTADSEDGPKQGEEGFYLQYSARKFLILPPLKASFGAEFRTEKSGYFGLGVSISRPMPYMADTFLEYYKKSGNEIYAVYPYGSKADENIPIRNQGMFLSVELRYFFQPSRHEREKVPSYIRDRNRLKNK